MRMNLQLKGGDREVWYVVTGVKQVKRGWRKGKRDEERRGVLRYRGVTFRVIANYFWAADSSEAFTFHFFLFSVGLFFFFLLFLNEMAAFKMCLLNEKGRRWLNSLGSFME